MIRSAISTLLAGALLLLLAPSASAQPPFPALTGRVVDAANVLPDAVEARLTRKLEGLERESRRQLVIATVPSLQGRDIADYGYQLGRAWGLGDKARNDGAVLLVAPAERKVRIETGYGLEGVLPDGMGFLVINNDIVPRFKAGDMAGGVEAGADAIIRQLTLPEAQAQRIAAQATGQGRSHGLPIVPIILVVFVLCFFVLPVVNSMRRRGRGGWGAPIVWASSSGSGSGSGSSEGGGSGSGGGTFSGGGGSFGGGGASGGW